MPTFDDEVGFEPRLAGDDAAAVAFLRSRPEASAPGPADQCLVRLGPQAEACALGIIEARADGVILLSASGSAISMNDAAVAILAAGDGLALVGGAFVAHRPPESRKLQRLVGDALSRQMPSGGQMLVSRRSAKRPYVVRVMPAPRLDRYFVTQGIACILFVQDLSRDTVSSETLRQLFGLSPREADVAAALVRRGNLQRAAADAGMATNTARNHLQAVFLKTGVNSQVALVALLSLLV